jgi:hydrogenase expression/formation protein HypE
MIIEEAKIPVREEVTAACELLGIDPLHLANEGKLLAFVKEEDAEPVLRAMHADPVGKDAAVIGRVQADPERFVELVTPFGGKRVLDWLMGEALPRIC